MKNKSMFARLITVFLAVILLCSTVLMAFYYLNTRASITESKVEELKKEAKEFAYLASLNTSNTLFFDSAKNTISDEYMRYKARNIYKQFNAYIISIDRSGKLRAYNLTDELLQDEDVLDTIVNIEDMSQTVVRVLHGEEVVQETSTKKGLMFTVAVPRIEQGVVVGGVVIQTAAQTIRSSYQSFLMPTIWATCIAFLFAALLSFVFTKQTVAPLTQMELSATKMSNGDFSVRVKEEGTSETLSLAHSFNQMATKLEEIEQSRKAFVANVSHELRSPITSIKGYLEGIVDGTIEKENQEKYIQIALSETDRMSKLIHNLLNLSRLENKDKALALSHFDLNETVRRGIIAKMAQIENKEIDLDVDFYTDPCYVYADQDQIEQVLTNLLDNAVKFSYQKGRIFIKTRERDKKVYFTIQNEGVPILPEDKNHIFDRFYKADKAHTVGKGTGLGLAISKCIMEKHGEHIKLLDADKTTFEISLKKGTSNRMGGNE